jgi:gamma-glutamylcyclotransferase
MRLWYYASQAILAQNPLTASLSAATTTTATTQSISPSTTIPSPIPTEPESIMSAASSTSSNTAPNTNTNTNTTLYFGYGSNLWLKQMHQRCPNSTYLGIARLNDFTWIINERGYANVVEDRFRQRKNAVDRGRPGSHLPFPESWNLKDNYERQVWGLVYSLQASDEERLDRNEGVPVAYGKEMLGCDFWAKDGGDRDGGSSGSANVADRKPEEVEMLVYINRKAVEPSEPKEEYVYRMNMGIRDAVKEGVPVKYVEKVMRKFIPEMEDEGEGEGEVVEVAKKQAAEFEDEK